MFAPRIVSLAIVCAAAGALQYAWNIRALWFQPQPPHGLIDAVRTFWFDVTKSDWRDTMVLSVPQSMLRDHAEMYWFDLRQQFGPVAPLLAAAGLVDLITRQPGVGTLMLLLFAGNLAFAFSYNVGDAHVFYLPSHYVLALLMAAGAARLGRVWRRAAPATAAVLLAYAAMRAYRDFPALDRAGDVRPAEVIGGLAGDLDDQRTILLADLNWQIGNGLSYYAKVRRPGIAHAHLPDVILYAPALVASNRAIGRDVALTERARTTIEEAYGPLLPTIPDPQTPAASFPERVTAVQPGARYVLCVLKPSRDLGLDHTGVAAALRTLTAGTMTVLPSGDYVAVAGIAGRPPDLAIGANLPFTRQVQLDGVPVEVRMEAWLSSDTIRRMGFGQVVAGRRHTLIVERGVSFAAFDAGGRGILTAYDANIFAPQRRYLIRSQD
jgi:hypothetical protein